MGIGLGGNPWGKLTDAELADGFVVNKLAGLAELARDGRGASSLE